MICYGANFDAVKPAYEALLTKALEGFRVRLAVQLSTSATGATVGGELFDSATAAYQDASRTTKAALPSEDSHGTRELLE